jgi:hypothetical protein
MPRLRLGDAQSPVIFGVGLSGGNYADITTCRDFGIDDECTRTINRLGYVLWANFEIGGEQWSSSGFAVRYFLGFADVLNPAALKCPSNESLCGAASSVVPYVGAGFGYAF